MVLFLFSLPFPNEITKLCGFVVLFCSQYFLPLILSTLVVSPDKQYMLYAYLLTFGQQLSVFIAVDKK